MGDTGIEPVTYWISRTCGDLGTWLSICANSIQYRQVTTSLTSVDVLLGRLLWGVIGTHVGTHLSIIDSSMAIWSRLSATSSSRWPAVASAKLLFGASSGPL